MGVQHADIDHTGITGVGGSETFTEAVHDLHDHTGITGVGGGTGILPYHLAPDYGYASFDGSGLTVGTANHAYFAPATLQVAATITGVGITVRTQNGNIDVGLYDEAGTRLASSGSVACPAAGPATVSFTSSYSAAPGRYHLAIACSNTTATFMAVTNGLSNASLPYAGRLMASAFPLPATATFSNTATRFFAMIGVVTGGYP